MKSQDLVKSVRGAAGWPPDRRWPFVDDLESPLPPPGSQPAVMLPPPTLPSLPAQPAADGAPTDSGVGTTPPVPAPPIAPTPTSMPTPSPSPAPSLPSAAAPSATPTAPTSRSDPNADFWTNTTGPVPSPNGRPGKAERSSKRPLMLTLAVVSILALGLGAFFVFGGDDGSSTDADDTDETPRELTDDGEPVDPGAYSFSAATATVDASPGLRQEMTIVAPEGDIEMTALLDRRERRMSVEFSGSLDDQTVGTMRMIADEPAATMYMSGELFETSVPWVAIDVTTFGDMVSTDDWFEDPADMTDMFTGQDPVDLGVESIDGEPLKHYEVTLSIEDMLAYDPASLEGFGTADLTILDSITFDLWVDETSRLRRMAFDHEVAGQSVSLDMRLEHIDEPISIPLPEPGDVMSLDEYIVAGMEDLGG